jgi:hypothetical protein
VRAGSGGLAEDVSLDTADVVRDVSTVLRVEAAIEQPNRTLQRRRTQVPVALRRPELAMPGELLDGSRGCATHREMRAEGVAQHVNANLHRLRASRRSTHVIGYDLRRQWNAGVVAEDALASKLPPSPTSANQRIDSNSSSLSRR